MIYQKCGKRLIDLVLSACGIVVLIPLWIVLAIAIKIDDPGPRGKWLVKIKINCNG